MVLWNYLAVDCSRVEVAVGYSVINTEVTNMLSHNITDANTYFTDEFT